MWEENWRDYNEGELSLQEKYDRLHFLEAPISKVLWDALSDLMGRWGDGQCRIDRSARQNRNSFANSWPKLLREQILRLLTEHEVTSEQSRRAGTAAPDGAERRDRGTRALKMADPRLHEHFIEEQFNIFDVSDMLKLITDLATSVSTAVNWDDEDEDEASWIEELRGKVGSFVPSLSWKNNAFYI